MAIKVLKVTTDSELLSYIINVTPELQGEIDLPVQGQDLKPIGKIIMNNERYKNAFLNTCNLIGLTIISRNNWDNPWENFTNKGLLRYGQQIRELIVDIADVFDYNEYANDPEHFLQNVIPNVYNYMHELNFQKFYKTTTSDEQMAMAFETEGNLFDFIERIVGSLYEGYKYDKYITDKYQLQKGLVEGRFTPVQIADYDNLTPRQRVSKMKSVSNLMTFRSPNYNPAGVRKATPFDNQIALLNTDFEADMSTEVLATSFFRNEAEMKTRFALIDGFGNIDEERLQELLDDQYEPFTQEELEMLSNVPAMVFGDDLFMDYQYALDNNSGLKQTEFYNPETLKRNHWLHVWAVISMSPFANGVVFVKDAPGITSVTINPSTLVATPGQYVQLNAVVVATNFANKSVQWSVDTATGQRNGHLVEVDQTGKVKIPADYDTSKTIKIKATSIYDKTKTATATISFA